MFTFSAATTFQPYDIFKTGLPAELQGQVWDLMRNCRRLKRIPYHIFLIRENDKKTTALSLSVKHQGDISHFLIEKDSDGYEIIG